MPIHHRTPTLDSLGLEVSAVRINQALGGIGDSVTAAALNTLTGGPFVDADDHHRHYQFYHTEAGEAELHLLNDSDDPAANIVLNFDLPTKLPDITTLMPDPATGWLRQRYSGRIYNFVGALPVQYRSEGTLAASVTGKLVGVVPADGVVSAVILSTGSNIASSLSTDSISATVKVKGTAVTSTDPKLTSAAGTGFRSTGQSQGTAAVIKTDGTQNVKRGDVLTVDLTRTAAGTVSSEASDVVVLVVIRPGGPE